jgi:PAS domain-containing protein
MATDPLLLERLAELRRRASTHLGGAPVGAQLFTQSDALAVLHDLAASPRTAADALALLHELQVQQVELELQGEELRESRAELEAMLQRQSQRYDHLPVGCFTIDRALVVHELNRRAAALLGLPREQVPGLRLDRFLSDRGAQRMRALLDGGDSAIVELTPRQGRPRHLRADLAADLAAEPATPHFLLTLSGVE